MMREQARELVIEQVPERARLDHCRNWHKLHVHRDGSLNWFETFDRNNDIIDDDAPSFAAIKNICVVGTGSHSCNCDYCNDAGFDSIDDAIHAAVVDSDLSGVEENMLANFDAIEVGYFDDEEQL
jgi:hypothetical protein